VVALDAHDDRTCSRVTEPFLRPSCAQR
jgi:hypothetical protein